MVRAAGRVFCKAARLSPTPCITNPSVQTQCLNNLSPPSPPPLLPPCLTVKAQESLEVGDLQRAEGLVVVAVEPAGARGRQGSVGAWSG